MRRKWFYILLASYLGLPLAIRILSDSDAYIEATTYDAYFTAHILAKIVAAILVGALFLLALKRASPVTPGNKKPVPIALKIAGAVALFALIFSINEWIVLPLNHIERSTDKKIAITGTVLDKYSSSGAGKGSSIHFLVIRDSLQHRDYIIRVKESIYRQYDKDNVFDKTMTEGMLGIIYRKED